MRFRDVEIGEAVTLASGSPAWNPILKKTGASTAVDDRGATVVLVDRSESGFDELAMGGPAAGDLADRGTNAAARVGFADAFAAPHPAAGATDGTLPRVHDGARPQNHDDTARWMSGMSQRQQCGYGWS